MKLWRKYFGVEFRAFNKSNKKKKKEKKITKWFELWDSPQMKLPNSLIIESVER